MDRKEIRILSRGLVDEYTEIPEGLIGDDAADEANLNILINIAQSRVELDLIPYIPWYFRHNVLISTVANQSLYVIGDGEDIDVPDFIAFENIYHNKAGDLPEGLAYAEPDQLADLQISAQAVGEPRCWIYEGFQTIKLLPTPTVAEAEKYKGYYFCDLHDLNKDDAADHDPSLDQYSIPSLPKITHPLVAIDAARQFHLIGEEEGADLEKRYQRVLGAAANNLLSIKPSLGYRGRGALGDNLR